MRQISPFWQRETPKAVRPCHPGAAEAVETPGATLSRVREGVVEERPCGGRGRVYCIIATSESVPKAGLPQSGLVVPLFQGQRWILTSAPAFMASHSSRKRFSWNLSPGEAGRLSQWQAM